MSIVKPLSGSQEWALAWFKGHSSGVTRRGYRSAGITTGTVSSLIVRRLVVFWCDEHGEYFYQPAESGGAPQ